jgi:hypothetical protein
VSAATTLETLRDHGYRVALDNTELVVKGPGPVPAEIRREIASDTAGVKAAVLLNNPPPWLEELFKMWWDGTETLVRRTDPATGRTKTYPVPVTVKSIATAVADKIGMDWREWGMLREEVEEALSQTNYVKEKE